MKITGFSAYGLLQRGPELRVNVHVFRADLQNAVDPNKKRYVAEGDLTLSIACGLTTAK